MSNQVFADAVNQIKSVLAGVEAEMERQGSIHAQQEAIRQTLKVLEQTEREARQRLDIANADVTMAQRKYNEAAAQAQQIVAAARAEAAAIKEKAITEGEETANRLAEVALEQARESVRRTKRGAGAA